MAINIRPDERVDLMHQITRGIAFGLSKQVLTNVHQKTLIETQLYGPFKGSTQKEMILLLLDKIADSGNNFSF